MGCPYGQQAPLRTYTCQSRASRAFLDPPERGLRRITLEKISEHPCLVRVRAPRVAPGLRRMPACLRRWLEHRWLRRLEQVSGCYIQVVWLFENSRFFDLRFAGSRLKLYHQVDLNQNFFPGIAAQTADICFCTSELIKQRLLPHNPKTYFLQHGTSAATTSVPLAEKQQSLLQGDSLKAAYVGNLRIPYLDWGLLGRVVKTHPSVQFHLIGGFDSQSDSYQHMMEMANVTLWGQVESAVIPSILRQMDILLLCYSQAYQEQVSNPHKLMEYFASGRTVVATYTDEYKQYRDLLVMSESGSNTGYSELFTKALSQLSTLNSFERMKARQAFAADHAYPRQLERIQALLLQNDLTLPITPSQSVLP